MERPQRDGHDDVYVVLRDAFDAAKRQLQQRMASLRGTKSGTRRSSESMHRPLIFAPQASGPFGARVAAAAGVTLSPMEEREFEGGEHKTRPLVSVRGADVFVVQSLSGDEAGSANDRLCRLLFFIAGLKDSGAARVTACVPFLAYGRKDRRTKERDPVTLRYVAQLVERSARTTCWRSMRTTSRPSRMPFGARSITRSGAADGHLPCRAVH